MHANSTGPRRAASPFRPSRSNIRPDDWVQYKGGSGFAGPKYDYEAHERGHYGGGDPEHEAQRRMNMRAQSRARKMYYENMREYDRKRKQSVVTTFATVGIGIAVMYYSGIVHLIFI
jgi:hypothetical protein